VIPIHELLNRIRWDPEFGDAAFVIGYNDRVKGCIVQVPLKHVAFAGPGGDSFEATDEDGSAHLVPYHRVREVYRDGVLIWRRPGPGEASRGRRPK